MAFSTWHCYKESTTVCLARYCPRASMHWFPASKHATSSGNSDFVDGREVWALRWRDYLGLSERVQSNHTLKSENLPGFGQKNMVRKKWSKKCMVVHFEDGGRETQPWNMVASRRWERQEDQFTPPPPKNSWHFDFSPVRPLPVWLLTYRTLR